MKSPLKLVYVEWVDSYGCTGTWEDADEVTAVIVTAKSIGWIVRETKDIICLCGNVVEETERTMPQVNGIMSIPKKCIVKTKKITIP